MITFATYHADLSPSTREIVRAHQERTDTNSLSWSGAESRAKLWEMIRMMFASATRTHPGCRTVLVTDRETEISSNVDYDVHRCADASPLPAVGRSAAWIDFLSATLSKNQEGSHIVLLDYDMLIRKSLEQVFDRVFDVGLTYRVHHRWPINAGIQFLHGGRLEQALSFHRKALGILEDRFQDWAAWCGDQWALQQLVSADFTREDTFLHHQGEFDLLLLPCAEYNYSSAEWNLSGHPYEDKRVLHFKGDDKPAMFDYWRLHAAAP